MANFKTLQQKAEHFQSHMGAMMLLVCRNITDEELQKIAKQKWDCVFSSHTGIEVASVFSAERIIREEIPRNPAELLNKAEGMPFIPVMKPGRRNPKKYVANDDVMHSIRTLLRTDLNRLIVVGYDYKLDDIGDDLDIWQTLLEQEGIHADSIEFWGISDPDCYEELEQIGCSVNKEKLSDLVEYITDRVRENFPDLDAPGYFYADGKAVSAPQNLILTEEKRMGVLTQKQIDRIRPNGKYACQQWFRNFLEYSSDVGNGHDPQWYAYSRRTDFSVKRDCDAPLLALVNSLLEGNKIGSKKSEDKDIGSVILAGDAGCGKSVTLSSLAYQVFQERVHPVVFITGRVRNQQVVDLLEGIEKACSDRYPKILVVWDCSAYRPQMTEQLDLIDYLKGRFHRFLMVYSAYATIESNETQIKHYRYKAGKGFVSCQDEADGTNYISVLERDDRLDYCVSMKRKLSHTEKESLWSKFRDHSSIESDRLREWKEKLDEEDDLFVICYKMINVLRDNYENHLDLEHNVVSSYVRDRLEEILGSKQTPEPDAEMPAWKIELEKLKASLKDTGITLADLGIDEIADEKQQEDEEEKSVQELLLKVDTHIAMFSRFEQLEVPYSYVQSLLINGEAGYSNIAYSTDKKEKRLFQLITTKIPWLRCGRNERGDFTCSFRKALEADIFLRNQKVTPKKQVEILEEMLDYYRDCLEYGEPISSLFVVNLGKLLRNMGPNTKYPPFQKGGNRQDEFEQISAAMHENIVDKLKDLCVKYDDVDRHFVCDYITFVREYNSPKSDTISTEGLIALREAAEMAFNHIQLERQKDVINNLQVERYEKGGRRYINGILETLRTEYAQCKKYICKYWIDYQRDTPRKDWCQEALEWNSERFDREYEDIFTQMNEALKSNPTKGMYYNVLFQSFLMMYDNFTKEACIDFLNELMQHVENSRVFRLEHSDSKSEDRLRDSIREINEKLDNFEFHLSILNEFDQIMENGNTECPPEKEKQFREYKRALESRDPTILMLACRRELYRVHALGRPQKVNREEIVTESMLEACKRVREYLDKHYACIQKNANGTWIILSAAWMAYSEGSILSEAEPRKAELDQIQWMDIYRYSKDHCIAAKILARPDACLLYVLSTYYTESFRASEEVLKNWISPIENNGGNRKKHPYKLCVLQDGKKSSTPMEYDAEVVQQDQNTYVEVHMKGNARPRRMMLSSLGARGDYKIGQLLKVHLSLGYAGYKAYVVKTDRR